MTPSVIDSSGVAPVITAAPLRSAHDLLPSEASFIAAMQQLDFGTVEHLQIRGGEVVLSPDPATVRHIKFGTPATTGKTVVGASELRPQLVEFFTYVRETDAGEIRKLEVRHGLPFSMEIDHTGAQTTAVKEALHG